MKYINLVLSSIIMYFVKIRKESISEALFSGFAGFTAMLSIFIFIVIIGVSLIIKTPMIDKVKAFQVILISGIISYVLFFFNKKQLMNEYENFNSYKYSAQISITVLTISLLLFFFVLFSIIFQPSFINKSIINSI